MSWSHLGAPDEPAVDRPALAERGAVLRRRRNRRRQGLAAGALAMGVAGVAIAAPLVTGSDATGDTLTGGFVQPTNGPGPRTSVVPTDDRADGVPGWFDPKTQRTCRPTLFDDAPSDPPAPGLELAVTAPTGPVVVGSTVAATYTLTSRSPRTVLLEGNNKGAAARLSNGRTQLAAYSGGPEPLPLNVNLVEADRPSTGTVTVLATTCADTSAGEPTNVPGGTYRIAVTIPVSAVTDPDGTKLADYGADPYRWTAVSEPFVLGDPGAPSATTSDGPDPGDVPEGRPAPTVAQARAADPQAPFAGGLPDGLTQLYATARSAAGEFGSQTVPAGATQSWSLVWGDVLNYQSGQRWFDRDEIVVRVATKLEPTSFGVSLFGLGETTPTQTYSSSANAPADTLEDSPETPWRD